MREWHKPVVVEITFRRLVLVPEDSQPGDVEGFFNESSHCIDSEKGQVCTRSCTTDCPKDWTCKTVQTDGADLSSICVPLFTNLCKPCKSHEDCSSMGAAPGSNLCVPLQAGDGFVNGSFCGTGCESDADCRDGYGCQTEIGRAHV